MTSIPVAICRYSDMNFKTPLSQKGKNFCGFFIAFLKWSWNWEHSEQKEQYSSLIITEIIAAERDIYLSVMKVLTGSKNCWSQLATTTFLFFHEFEKNWAVKTLP